jgi:hypothetical protein
VLPLVAAVVTVIFATHLVRRAIIIGAAVAYALLIVFTYVQALLGETVVQPSSLIFVGHYFDYRGHNEQLLALMATSGHASKKSSHLRSGSSRPLWIKTAKPPISLEPDAKNKKSPSRRRGFTCGD